MRALWVLVLSCTAAVATAQAAAKQPVAVFDFELIDTSLDGEMNGTRADEQRRIQLISNTLRTRLGENEKIQVIDIGPVTAKAHAVHLQECGGCDADLAAKVGGKLAITGTVQKVSNLILNMSIYVRDAASGHVVAMMSADMRGNTDESWLRTVDWLVRNRLLLALDGVQQ
jgi:hypothetical protein